MRLPVIVASGFVVLAAGIAAFVLLGSSEAPRREEHLPVSSEPLTVPPSTARGPAEAPAPPRTRERPVDPAPAPAAPVTDVAPTTGTLHIEADVPDASVFLDRVGVGTAPLTIPNVPVGSHRINVSAKGYDGFVETIDVEPGDRTVSVKFLEIRLDARVDAVHKHGMGSCRGRVVASPDGLRYEAAAGSDSFSVTFADLVQFDVDYLEKNLRLRTRQGRTYNFTHPSGSADELYRFHQEVEKVRKRVAAP